MSGNFTFMKGNIEIIILCSLYKGDKYGYELAKEIKEKTSNRYEIKQPTLYAYLKRLEEENLIESYWGESSNGGRRRYYKLTPQGRINSEEFVSEWQYHKDIMSDLVDDTATVSEVSQSDVTPMFGRKNPSKRNRKNSMQTELDEQEEISRRLKELAGDAVSEAAVDETDASKTAIAEKTETVTDEKNTGSDALAEISLPNDGKSAVNSETESHTTSETVDDTAKKTTESGSETVSTVASNAEDRRAIFDVKQDDADEFIQGFDALAQEAATRQPTAATADDGENYQHVLLNVIGDQLDGIKSADTDSANEVYYSDRPAALEEIAAGLIKEGIQIRIYSHATATYKSKVLMPLAKVLCQTSWLTYIFPVIFFTILSLASISNGNWAPMIIAAAAAIIFPACFTVYAIMNPARKVKPPFNFGMAIVAASLFSLIVILASIGVSTLNKIEFSNFAAVSNQILIPTGLALMPPIFVTVFNFLYKKY